MLRGKRPHVKAQARYLPSCSTGASYPAYDRRISSWQGGGPMAPLFILLISLVILRGVGYLGVGRLSSWREAGFFAAPRISTEVRMERMTDLAFVGGGPASLVAASGRRCSSGAR